MMKKVMIAMLLLPSLLISGGCNKKSEEPVNKWTLNVTVYCNNNDANNEVVYVKLVEQGTACQSASSPLYINLPSSLATNPWENNLQYASFEMDDIAEGTYSWCAFIDMDRSSLSESAKIPESGDLTASGTVSITGNTDLVIGNTSGTGWGTF